MQLAAERRFQCEIYIHPGRHLPTLSLNSYAFQKDFPYLEIIDYSIHQIQMTGLYKRLQQKYFSYPIRDCAVQFFELDYRSTILMFIVLGSGILISLLVFVSEQAMQHSKINREVPKDWE